MRRASALILAATVVGCASAATVSSTPNPARDSGSLAQVFYWKAKPGMLDQYNRYITEVAEPIDAEARKHDAFVSVTTYMSRDTLSPWTHMRVFVLRDSAQLAGLSASLDAAGKRLEPDSVKRRVRGEYAATLRDRVGGTVLAIVR